MSFDFVADAVKGAAVNAQVLERSQQDAVIGRLRERFGLNARATFLWDATVSEHVAFECPSGWQLIPRFIGASECLMFESRARTIWRFGSGDDLLRVLEDAPALEYYVCDVEVTYLLCHNHHDYLIGWGAAAAWVIQLSENDGADNDLAGKNMKIGTTT